MEKNDFHNRNLIVASGRSHIKEALERFADQPLLVVSKNTTALDSSNENAVFIDYGKFYEVRSQLNPKFTYLLYSVSESSNVQAAKTLLNCCISITQKNLVVLDNYYDSDYHLENVGFKTIASNLNRNATKLTTNDYLNILKTSDIAGLSILGSHPIISSEDKAIIPLETPINYWPHRDQELASAIKLKKQCKEFDFCCYRYIYIVCDVKLPRIQQYLPNLKNTQLISFFSFTPQKLIKDVISQVPLDLQATDGDNDFLEGHSNHIHILESSQQFTSKNKVELGESLEKSIFSNDFLVPHLYFSEIRNATVLSNSNIVLTEEGRILEDAMYLLQTKQVAHSIAEANRPYPVMEFEDDFCEGGCSYLLANAGWKNYYHWTIQCLSSVGLLAYLPEGKAVEIVTPPLSKWQKRGLELAGVELCKTRVIASGMKYFSRLVYPSLLSGKYAFNPWQGISSTFSKIREGCLLDSSDDTFYNTLIYVARFDSNRRTLLNENALVEMLIEKGFSVIIPGELSLDEQIRIFYQAKVVVGSHGAGLTNIVYCRPRTILYELFPKHYINHCFFRLAQIFDVDYWADAFSSVDTATKSHHNVSWQVDLNRVSRRLDLILKNL